MDLGKLLGWMAARGVQLTIAKAGLVTHLQLDARCGGRLFRACRVSNLFPAGEEEEARLVQCLEEMLAEIEHRETEVPVVPIRRRGNHANHQKATTTTSDEPERSQKPGSSLQVE